GRLSNIYRFSKPARQLSLHGTPRQKTASMKRPQTQRRIPMATNFTAIVSQRQHFGDEQGTFNDVEPNLNVITKKDFTFDCPNVNPNETAFLIFQSRDVDHQKNIFRVNKVDVSGGLPASPSRDSWNG